MWQDVLGKDFLHVTKQILTIFDEVLFMKDPTGDAAPFLRNGCLQT